MKRNDVVEVESESVVRCERISKEAIDFWVAEIFRCFGKDGIPWWTCLSRGSGSDGSK